MRAGCFLDIEPLTPGLFQGVDLHLRVLVES
jgi:hypothetical protein